MENSGAGRSRRIDWKRTGVRAALAAVPLAMLLPVALGWFPIDTLSRFENYLYDVRVRLTMPGGVDRRVVIVDVDEASLAAEGHWPWNRTKLAALVDALFDRYGARVVAFDMFFPEPEEASALALLRELQPAIAHDPQLSGSLSAIRARYESDKRFAESLIARDVILGYAFKSVLNPGDSAETGVLPAPIGIDGERLDSVPWIEARGFAGNLAILQANASGAGFFDTPLTDEDGVIRRMPLLQRYAGKLYESLDLATARLALHGEPVRFGFSRKGRHQRLEFVAIGEREIPVDPQGAMLTPFRGHVSSFPYVSATRVLHGQAPSAVLKGAIVLIGTSSPGLNDIRPTPVDRQYIGVEAHANVIAGILDGAILAQPTWVHGFDAAVLCVLALLFIFAMPRLAPGIAFAGVMTLAALLVGLSLLMWMRAGVVLPLATAFAYLAATGVVLVSYEYFVESRRKRRLSRIFSQYVPAEIVQELDAMETDVSLEGESREMTVLFSDVRGFTTLSEGLSPRELTRLMNEMLTPLTEVIHRQRGTIDKYMGDAIMAFWGAPLADAGHAQNAVSAALEMIECTARVRAEFAARGWPAVHIGVGVSSGPMNVGNMGSRFRMAYTVLGDVVNLGSRLEGLTKQYGVDVIVSGATAALVPNVLFRELDLVRVKGKKEPVAILEPMGFTAVVDAVRRARAQRFHEFLQRYRQQEFARAGALLEELSAEGDEPLFALYRQRITHFIEEPPGRDWDGVFVHQTK